MPIPKNEPIYGYGPGSTEKSKLKAELQKLSGQELEIRLIIDGE